jgi:hypothetical protein
MGSAANSLRDALIALRREKDKTEKAIAALEAVLKDMGAETTSSSQYSLGPVPTPPLGSSTMPPKWYGGMTIGDAAVQFLRDSGRWVRVPEIWRTISAAGIHSGSKNPPRMLYNILTNRLDKDLAKRGPTWGLKEWEQQ